MNIDASSSESIIVMNRVFDAPRDVVWAVFTDPKHVAKWYGGHGFSNPVCEMDVRPGGKWRHVMRTPDGTDFALEFVFVEVVKPEKLVWQNSDYDRRPPGAPPATRNTVTLEDCGAQTKWTLVALFRSVAERDTSFQKGFTKMVTQGSEKLNDIVKAVAAARNAGIGSHP